MNMSNVDENIDLDALFDSLNIGDANQKASVPSSNEAEMEPGVAEGIVDPDLGDLLPLECESPPDVS